MGFGATPKKLFTVALPKILLTRASLKNLLDMNSPPPESYFKVRLRNYLLGASPQNFINRCFILNSF